MSVTFDQHHILLVDDEPFSRDLVSRMLWRCGFQEVSVAEDGYRAIEFLNTGRITAVLTDFRMPGIHGLQLLKKIRMGETRAPRNLVCGMVTSHAERHLVNLAIVLDIDAFLAKPVSLDTLQRRLSRAFQYRFEPLELAAYAQVDVDNAAPHLSFTPPATAEEVAEPEPPPPPPAPPAQAPPPPPPPKLYEMTPEERAERDQVAPPPKPKVKPRKTEKATEEAKLSPAEPSKEKASPKKIKQVRLDEIPEGAVLARNIIGTGGTLLLAAGTPFRSRYLRRLEELNTIDQAVETVWIFED